MNPADCSKCGSSKSMCVCGVPEDEDADIGGATDLEGRLEQAFAKADQEDAGEGDDGSL